MATPNTIRAVEPAPTPSEMENLEAKLSHAAKSLELMADRLTSRVDHFVQRGDSAGVDEMQEPQPMPGTLSALHYWMRRIDRQSGRLGAAVEDVATII